VPAAADVLALAVPHALESVAFQGSYHNTLTPSLMLSMRDTPGLCVAAHAPGVRGNPLWHGVHYCARPSAWAGMGRRRHPGTRVSRYQRPVAARRSISDFLAKRFNLTQCLGCGKVGGACVDVRSGTRCAGPCLQRTRRLGAACASTSGINAFARYMMETLLFFLLPFPTGRAGLTVFLSVCVHIVTHREKNSHKTLVALPRAYVRPECPRGPTVVPAHETTRGAVAHAHTRLCCMAPYTGEGKGPVCIILGWRWGGWGKKGSVGWGWGCCLHSLVKGWSRLSSFVRLWGGAGRVGRKWGEGRGGGRVAGDGLEGAGLARPQLPAHALPHSPHPEKSNRPGPEKNQIKS
jgi:hypothetical protein